MLRAVPTALLQPPAREAEMKLRQILPTWLIARFAAVAAIALAGCQTPPTAPDALPPAVLQALQKANVPASALAAAAIPLGPAAAGLTSWRHRADVAMQPASTMKLVTSVVALARLGPNHRGTTQLRSAAPVVAGVLQGDLVLQGGADPELGVPQFWALLLDLRQRGITTVAGDLLIDRTLFQPPRQDADVPPFDDAPEFPYNAIPDALQLAGNLLTFEISDTPAGVQAAAVPPLPGLAFDGSGMATVDAPCAQWGRHWKPADVAPADATGAIRIALRGGFPRGCTQRVQLQLIDRLALADRLFRTLWQGLGGQWTGSVRDAAAPAGTALLAQHTSRPWGELLRVVNKESDNPLARLLFLQLGVPQLLPPPPAPGQPPAPATTPSPAPLPAPTRPTTDLAADTVRAWFAQHGIDTAGLVLDNGSGLSRSERITPWQLVQMLRATWDGPNAADLVMSLPTAGVDGTMRSRLQASPAAGWARLKTGGLRNVAAVAGYVRDAAGRPWAVAAMINHDDASLARPALDAWIDGIARGDPFTAAAAGAGAGADARAAAP